MFVPSLEATVITIKLLDEYRGEDSIGDALKPDYVYVSPEAFLQEYFAQNIFSEDLQDVVVEFFFKVSKYRKYLTMVINELFASKAPCPTGSSNEFSLNLVFLYLLIIELNNNSKDKIETLLKSLNIQKAVSMIGVLKKPGILTKLYECGYRIWDVDYVKEVLQNVIKEPLFQELHENITYHLQKVKKVKKKELTVPVGPKCLTRPRKFVPVPEVITCPPPVSKIPIFIKATRLPKTTYIKPRHTERLEEARIRNREKSKKLLAEAQKMAFKCSHPEKSEKFRESLEKIEKERLECLQRKLSAKRIKPKEVACPKKTAAVILREGARLLKLEQEEIKRYEDLANGGFNSDAITELEEEIREEEFRKRLEDIQKKHLEGLLSYEEALLARQKCLRKKKESADEFRKEKEIWIKQLEEWRIEEQQRIQESVERGKAYEKGGKEAVESVKEEKHRLALETMEESRLLKERWLKEKEEDLQRKVQLIKEIKALQTLGVLRKKEIDLTETSNMGFLYEMSIAELRERLFILKIELKEELEKKRAEVKMRRECRKEIIEGYQELIESHQRIAKEQKERTEEVDKKEKKQIVQRSSSIESLRRKLYETRMKRIKEQVCL